MQCLQPQDSVRTTDLENPEKTVTQSFKPKIMAGLFAGILATGLTATVQAEHKPHHSLLKQDRGGVIYAMDNSASGNHIHVYLRKPNGTLTPLSNATIATGGIGGSNNAAIDPLGSQNSLLFDEDNAMLFAVNAGDNTITAFTTHKRGLKLHKTDQVDSGGFIPVSISVKDDLLYVLNAGGTASVSTFHISKKGKLELLDNLPLNLDFSTSIPFNNIMAPGQVGLDTLERKLIIANAGGQELLSAALDDNGLPTQQLVSTPTPGLVPFSFDVSANGTLLVSEAASGSVSSFKPSADNTPLSLATAALPTGQQASCWIVSTDSGLAFVANTGSDSISAYQHSLTGQLTLLQAQAGAASGAPTDMTLAGDERYLYSLDASTGSISGFAIDASTGELTLVETESGLPAASGIQGIAAYDFK